MFDRFKITENTGDDKNKYIVMEGKYGAGSGSKGEVKIDNPYWFGRKVTVKLKSLEDIQLPAASIDFNRGSLIDYLNARGKGLDKGGLFRNGSSDEAIQKAFDEVVSGKEILLPQPIVEEGTFWKPDLRMMGTLHLASEKDADRMKAFKKSKFGEVELLRNGARECLQEIKKETGSSFKIESDTLKFIGTQDVINKLKKHLRENSAGEIKLENPEEKVGDDYEISLTLAESGLLFGYFLASLGDPTQIDKVKKNLDSIRNQVG